MEIIDGKIQFEFLGFHLMEPMAIIMNLILCGFSLFAYSKLRKYTDSANVKWKLFYLSFGISTFFGAMGHAFFNYFDIYGKFPCWILGSLANVYAATGMLKFPMYARPKKFSYALIWTKSILLTLIALATQKFIFIAIDAILTYIIYTGTFGYVLLTRGLKEAKLLVIGVLILLPSAFIFILKINIHDWFNKDDFSHVLMLGCIVCFYLGMNQWGVKRAVEKNHGA